MIGTAVATAVGTALRWTALSALTLAVLIVAYALSLVVSAFMRYRFSRRHYASLPAHPDSFALFKMRTSKDGKLFDFFRKMRRPDLTYPPFVVLGPNLDGGTVVGVTDPMAVRRILQNVELFPKEKLLYSAFRSVFGLTLTSSSGAWWKQHRTLFQPVFLPLGVHNFLPRMVEVIDSWLGTRLDAVAASGEVVDAAIFRELFAGVLTRTLFGGDVDPQVLRQAVLRAEHSMPTYAAGYMLFGPLWRLWRALPIGPPGTVKRSYNAMYDAIFSAVAARRKAKAAKAQAAKAKADADGEAEADSGAGPAPGADLIDVMLNLAEGELADTDLARICCDLVIPGHIAPALGLSWMLWFAAQNRRAWARLQAEVDYVTGANAGPKSPRSPRSASATGTGACDLTVDDLARMPYLRACVMEAFRLRPTGQTRLERTVAADTVVQGQTLRKGDAVSIMYYVLHTNGAHWVRPDEWVPERFLRDDDDDGAADATATAGADADAADVKTANSLKGSAGALGAAALDHELQLNHTQTAAPAAAAGPAVAGSSPNNAAFLPFSAGPRQCPGQHLGIQQVLAAAAAIVGRYDVEVIEPEKATVVMSATAVPVNVKFRFRRRAQRA